VSPILPPLSLPPTLPTFSLTLHAPATAAVAAVVVAVVVAAATLYWYYFAIHPKSFSHPILPADPPSLPLTAGGGLGAPPRHGLGEVDGIGEVAVYVRWRKERVEREMMRRVGESKCRPKYSF